MAVKTLADAAPDEVRFAELRRRMPGVSQKMLSVKLRSMTGDGLVSRRVEPTVPPRRDRQAGSAPVDQAPASHPGRRQPAAVSASSCRSRARQEADSRPRVAVAVRFSVHDHK